MRATNAKMTDFAAFSGRCIEGLRLAGALRKSMLFSVFSDPGNEKSPQDTEVPRASSPGRRGRPTESVAEAADARNLVAFDKRGNLMHPERAMTSVQTRVPSSLLIGLAGACALISIVIVTILPH
jgi:hypothetical protein